jgi:GH15 family glucan-1,4-alpha-glucosidase
METETFRPIADYGLLADCNSAALVDRRGSIDWLCLPRYDSPAVFARILDPAAGHFSIAPARPFEVSRRYLPGTLVIETTFTTEDGTARLIDALSFAAGQRGHELGLDCAHELLRLVEGVEGSVELKLVLAPRPEYGLVRPLLRKTEVGGRSFGGPNQIALDAGIPIEIEEATMRASFTVAAGGRTGFALRWAPPSDQPEPTAASAVGARIDDAVEAWRSWEAEHDIYEAEHRDLVKLSSRTSSRS